MNRRGGARLALLSCAVAACALGIDTALAEVDYGIDVGVGYSDDISRVDVNQIDETIAMVGLDLNWLERTRRLDADVTVDAAYHEYLDNTYEGEVVGTANGSLLISLLPERFTWMVQDSFAQAQVDPFAPVTPESRENINYVTTGPDLIVRLGSAASMRLFGRYSATQYEESNFDAERQAAGVSLTRRPSAATALGLNVITEETDFDDPLNTDFDRRSAFLNYDLEGGRTELSAQLGYSWLERDVPDAEVEGGALVDIGLTRELTSASTLRFSIGTQFTDAGEALRSALDGQMVGGADITSSADPFENRHASLEWLFSRNRTTFSLGASWNEDRYEEQTLLDRTRRVYSASGSRRMARTLTLAVHASLNDEQFDNTGFGGDELIFGTSVTWRVGRTLSFAVTYDRFDRDTSDNSGEYVENRFFFILTYRPGGFVAPLGEP